MSEKQKQAPGSRPRLKRVLPPPGDFIALGKSSAAKPRATLEGDIKSQMPVRKNTAALTSLPPKRKEPISINPVLATQTRTYSPLFGRLREPAKALDIQLLSSVKLIEAQPIELEELVLAAYAQKDFDEVDGLVCGAIKSLRGNRLKPDPMLYLTLTNLAKLKSAIFTSKQIVEHLLQFLRRDNLNSAVKPKPNTLLSIMTCNILLTAFQYEDSWPQSFMKVYVEDALGDRAWVDNENNKDFIKNIVSIFGTVLPSKISTSIIPSVTLKTETDTVYEQLSESIITADDENMLAEITIPSETDDCPVVQNRYQLHKDELAIHAYVIEIVKEQLNKRQMIDSVNRNLLRFLTSVCGYKEVRLLASQRIESWLQNPKLTRPAQDLLMSVSMNCNTHSLEDVEVIVNIVKMKLKTKPTVNYYTNCVRELISQHPDNLGTLLKHVIYNELSQQRNPNNMSTITVIFSAEPDKAAKYLSLVFQDLLCSREDYLRALRALLREIVRALKYEVNLVEFCRGMMQEKNDFAFVELEQPIKARMFFSTIDLICLGCFLCVSPAVKELAVSLSRGEKRDYSVLQAFQTQMSIIQRDSVWFFHTRVVQMYRCSEKDFVLGLNRILFLEANEHYNSKDNWPSETERNALLQLTREVPLAEDTLLRLHLLGLSDEAPINCADTLDIVEKMVLRAASLKSGINGLDVERTEVLQMLLNLSAYTYPRDIKLPHGYVSPSLAISTLYWKSWLILLVLVANSPFTIGLEVWENYPTARCMMEMLITGHYEFPPFGVGNMTGQEIRGTDLQIQRAEREDIIVFEGHLAAATNGNIITEDNSLLISQLISLDPMGPPRSPMKPVIDQMKLLNETFGLGKMLCRCRDPDFLLSIINNQGATRMPWLADLVHSSEGSLNTLPVQCLCEFLLMKYSVSDTDTFPKTKSIKAKVAARLKDLLTGDEASKQSAAEVTHYFIHRWSSSVIREREAAIDGFQSILLLQQKPRTDVVLEEYETDENSRVSKKCSSKITIPKDPTYSWLHEKLPTLTYFEEIKTSVTNSLRQALHKEVNIQRLQAYVIFLTKYHKELGREFTDSLAVDLAQLITCRKTITCHLLAQSSESGRFTFYALLELFVYYTKTRILPFQDNSHWKQNADEISVFWSGNALHSGKYSFLHICVIHASIVLLSFSSVLDDHEGLTYLQKTWFPKNGKFEARRVNTTENIDIFQHWLRMFMVQSTSDLLVQAGFQDLPCEQLILFLQTSGMSVASLNRLLTLLDKYTESEPEELINQVADPDRIISLVELAQSRGACGGERLCSLLVGDCEKEEALNVVDLSKDLSFGNVQDLKMESACDKRTVNLSNEFCQVILVGYFAPVKVEDPSVISNFNELKRQLARACISSTRKDGLPDLVSVLLLKLLQENEAFRKGFLRNKKDSKMLLTYMLKRNESKEKLKELFFYLKEAVPSSTSVSKLVHHTWRTRYCSSTSHGQTVSFSQLLDQFLKSNTEVKIIENAETIIKILEDGSVDVPKEKMIKVTIHFVKNCRSLCESFINALASSSSNQLMSMVCIEILIAVLSSVDCQCNGLLTDWLSVLDPEILRFSPILQRELIFLEKANLRNNSCNSVSLLISLLSHQAQDSTLDDCFNWLLNAQVDLKKFNATVCLDFLTAMFYHPRLWQGQENKHKQTNAMNRDFENIPDSFFESSARIQHLHNLIHLILQELSQNIEQRKLTRDVQSNTSLLVKRLTLLNNCRGQKQIYLKKAVAFARTKKNFTDTTMSCFMTHVYMKWPSLFADLQGEINDAFTLPQDCKTELDCLIHRLVLSISEPSGLQEWEEKFRNVSSLNRRLAVRHPCIFMRQLSFILSTLRGKSKMSPGTFKLTNQLMFYTHVFGLVDLLKPYVFAETESSMKTMMLFLEVFIQLIQSPCLTKEECSMIIKKLVEFLNDYITSGNKHAVKVFQANESVFKDLAYDYPNLPGLSSVCTISSWSVQSQSQLSLVAIHDAPLSEMQLTSFKRRLSADHHHKDLLTVILDLDETSKRRTDIIEHFTDELSALVFSTHKEVRERSHMLLLRFFNQSPRNSSRLIELYLKCLNSVQLGVIQTAAEHATEAIILADKKCDVLLKKMHKIAITTTDTEMSSFVIAVIKSLNIDFA